MGEVAVMVGDKSEVAAVHDLRSREVVRATSTVSAANVFLPPSCPYRHDRHGFPGCRARKQTSEPYDSSICQSFERKAMTFRVFGHLQVAILDSESDH